MKKIIVLFLSATFISVAAFAVNCRRTVSILSPKEMKVEITINKNQVSGIARLAESIPNGAVIKYAKSEGGTFNIVGNKIKFIWMSLPSAQNVSVVYNVNTENMHQGDYAITGQFSYLDGNQTHEITLDTSSFLISPTNEIKPISVAQTLIATTPSAPASNISSNPITSTHTVKVIYGVQVASTSKQLPMGYFTSKYNLEDKVKVTTMNGMYKYVFGEFDNINDANKYRETLKNKGVKGAFIVAFVNNERISINEAKKLETASK